jgi:hypothetical protein
MTGLIYKRLTKPKIKRKARSRVMIIAIILLILNLTNKFTTGCRMVAMSMAKTIGTMILLAIYKIATRAISPTRNIVILT